MSYGLNIKPEFSDKSLEQSLLFSIVPLFWWLIRPMFQRGHYYESSNRELQKIIFSNHYIESLSRNSRPLPPFFSGMKEIILGKNDAPFTLTLIVSPTCPMCSVHFKELERILPENPQFRVKVILATGTNYNEISSKVTMELLSLPQYEIAPKLKEWFNLPDYRIWNRNKPIEITMVGREQLELSSRWLMMANVNVAPTLFLENIRLSRVYNINSIVKLCEVLQRNESEINL